MTDKNRYILTAAIGDKPAGGFIELTAAQAASPLYASRIGPVHAGGESGSYDDIRAQVLGELEAQVPEFLADAKRSGEQILADARAKADELLDKANADAKAVAEKAAADAKGVKEAAQTEATAIVQTAQAEAMKLATSGKK